MDIIEYIQILTNYLSKIDGVVALVIGYLFSQWQFKFESIHKRRLDVIEEAYSKLKLASMAFRSLAAPLQEFDGLTQEEQEEKKEKDFADKANGMFVYLDTKRLFFSSKEQENIDVIISQFFQTWNNYRYKKDIRDDHSMVKERTRLYKEIWDSTSQEIPKLISSLEVTFKKALGLK